MAVPNQQALSIQVVQQRRIVGGHPGAAPTRPFLEFLPQLWGIVRLLPQAQAWRRWPVWILQHTGLSTEEPMA